MKLSEGAVITDAGSSINNKTGSWRTFKPAVDFAKCIQCMICWQSCPDMAIPQENGKRKDTDLGYCKGCGICAEVCPVKCIAMEKEEK